MRALHLLAFAALALSSLGACKNATKSVDATEAECVAYRNKLFSLLPADEQHALAVGGMDKPSPKEIELCRERMNSDEIACIVKATTLDDALACQSATDDRPEHVKRSAEECKAYGDHLATLGQDSQGAQAFGPPMTVAMVKLTVRECRRWLTKKRYDCVMQQPSTAGIIGCPP